jgi:hypothetical protein
VLIDRYEDSAKAEVMACADFKELAGQRGLRKMGKTQLPAIANRLDAFASN